MQCSEKYLIFLFGVFPLPFFPSYKCLLTERALNELWQQMPVCSAVLQYI